MSAHSIAYGPARLLPGDQIHITTNPDTEPFWLAAKEHRLTACQCASCGAFRLPPTPYCPICASKERTWPTLPGTGTVFSYAICSKNPATGEDYVYVPVVVEIDGARGARLVGNLTGCNAEDVRIGTRVVVEWTDICDGWVLPNFRALSDR
ncbi:Zn-ribbon domain-containing OB-fold protein [Sphingomonas azotifigens]|uniref:Zn-ribbon domain-containing OB-fold protein n=1 Tax=Sphingomonas azotifigens TaxID=330920 RepID=UPI0009FE53E6|nr:OB-fold domain-containing protein [Sphingomonas azotifigens]